MITFAEIIIGIIIGVVVVLLIGNIIITRQEKKKIYDGELYLLDGQLYLIPDDDPKNYKNGDIVIFIVKDIKQREKR